MSSQKLYKNEGNLVYYIPFFKTQDNPLYKTGPVKISRENIFGNELMQNPKFMPQDIKIIAVDRTTMEVTVTDYEEKVPPKRKASKKK